MNLLYCFIVFLELPLLDTKNIWCVAVVLHTFTDVLSDVLNNFIGASTVSNLEAFA